MKKGVSVFILVTLIVTSLIGNFQLIRANGNVFYDVAENYWGYNDIKKAYEDGIIRGMGNDPSTGKIIFNPNGALTVAQFVTFIGRNYYPEEMSKLESEGGAWYDPAFKLAQNHHLLKNTSLLGDFQRQLNRYQFARILYNMLEDFEYPMPTPSQLREVESKIGDSAKVKNSGFDKSVYVAMYLKLVSGVDSRGTFYGEKNLTRAELTAFYVKSKDFKTKLLSEKGSKNSVVLNNKMDKNSYALEVLRLVNAEREKMGIAALRSHGILQDLAQKRSEELLSHFSHNRPNGEICFSILDDYELSYFACGENIAAGQASPSEVVKAWMNSQGHRANILNPEYTHMGVGYIRVGTSNAEYPTYWAQIFIKE